MTMFSIGAIVGGMIGFLLCAVLSINNTGRKDRQFTLQEKEAGEDDAGSK